VHSSLSKDFDTAFNNLSKILPSIEGKADIPWKKQTYGS
jgi:hypothetical protein